MKTKKLTNSKASCWHHSNLIVNMTNSFACFLSLKRFYHLDQQIINTMPFSIFSSTSTNPKLQYSKNHQWFSYLSFIADFGSYSTFQQFSTRSELDTEELPPPLTCFVTESSSKANGFAINYLCVYWPTITIIWWSVTIYYYL
jgi:hypothetical protein